MNLDKDKLKKAFQRETGIKESEVQEITEAYPVSYTIHIYTMNKTFTGKLTSTGRVVKNSIKETE